MSIIEQLEQNREERERREARDRILAREVGIEIGRRREALKYERERNKSWSRGFLIGMIVAIIIMIVGMYGADQVHAQTRTIIGTGTNRQVIIYKPHASTLPPAWRVWLRICQAEQPAHGWGWAAVAWTNTHNSSFPGGCGLTRDNYSSVRHHGWPDTMDLLSPRDQVWACFWLFWKHARIGEASRGYAGGQRYGSTVWDVHNAIGFHGFASDGETPA